MTHYILDCDGVLLDWESGFSDFLTARGIDVTQAAPSHWDVSRWIGCDQAAGASWVQRFNASSQFAELKPMPGAVEFVHALLGAGHTVSVLTSCGRGAAGRARVQNLMSVFGRGAFDHIHVLDLGQDKFDFLWGFTRNRDPRSIVFVEDNFQHARSGAVNGITSYCLRRLHNRDQEAEATDTGVIWIDSLRDIPMQIAQKEAAE